MKHMLTRGGGCLLAIALASTAFGADATDQRLNELTDLVKDLRAEIDVLRAEDDTWLNAARAEEVRSIVEDVLADADTRTAMLNGAMAGYDGGFFIGNDDGSFKLKINGQTQVRYVYNYQDNADDGDDNRAGFSVRRAKLKLKGTVANDWKFGVTGAFGSNTGDFNLEDAFIAYGFDNGMTLKMGQFKGPFMREELVSSSKQLLVDRSLVNEEFNQDFTQGVQLSGKSSDDNLRWAVSYNDGFKADNTSALFPGSEYAFTGRVELLGAGDWKQFSDFTSKMGSDYGMMVGVAAHYERGEYGTSIPNKLQTFSLTGDVSLEFDGANIFASVVWRSDDNDADIDADRLGFTVQGGYYVNEDYELFARYEYGDPDSDIFDDLSAMTVGFNRYFEGHKAKWTTDIGYGFDTVDLFWASPGVGWRADSADSDGQVVVRSQFQLLF